MTGSKLYKIGVFLFGLYLANRITYLSFEIFKDLLYYEYENFELRDRSLEGVFYLKNFQNFLVSSVPLNPYFVLGWSPIIFLNAVLLIFYFKKRQGRGEAYNKISLYYYSIILIFLFSLLLFVLFSYFNNFQYQAVGADRFYKLYLESYAPYAPRMICGFIIGQCIFGLLWVFVFERFVFKNIVR